MRLPFTDKFLWDLYNFIEKIDKTFELFYPRTMKEVWFPDLYKLKRGYGRKKDRQQFSQLIYYLKKKGYIKIKNLEEKQAVLLTKKGTDKVLKIKFKTKEKKKRLDGKWQMVIFDIPEDIKNKRDYFRYGLKRLKYQKLQQSIWICPYDVLKDTDELIKYLKLDSFARLLLIEEIKI